MQTRNLHNDAVVRKTFNKRVGQSFGHNIVVVVARLMAHIEHRLLDVAHLVAQQIHSNHGQRITFVCHVFGVGIVYAKILAEAQGLRL